MDINTLKLFGFLIFVFPGSIFWLLLAGFFLVKRDMRLEMIERQKTIDKQLAQFEEECKKPMSFIQFYDQFGQKHTTDVSYPRYGNEGSKRWFWLNTSKMEAEKLLAYSYERGFFRNKEGTTFPACNIREATVEVVSGT